jgi:hypothetical protein
MICYEDNIINRNISSGLAGFAAVFIILTIIELVPVFRSYLELLIVIMVIHAIRAFVIGAVLELIGLDLRNIG